MLDTDGNGKLSLDEFQSWFLKNYFGGDGDDEDDKIGIKLRRLAQNGKKRLATDIFRASWEGNLNIVKSFVQAALAASSSERKTRASWAMAILLSTTLRTQGTFIFASLYCKRSKSSCALSEDKEDHEAESTCKQRDSVQLYTALSREPARSC